MSSPDLIGGSIIPCKLKRNALLLQKVIFMTTFFRGKKILVTGGSGFLGSHLVPKLEKAGAQVTVPRSNIHDLRRQKDCKRLVQNQDIVIHLAAKVGGIGFNMKYPGEMFYVNVMMGTQLMEESRLAKLKKFISIGTVCSYPKYTKVPFKEKDLWEGYPEETNAPYGIAKKMLLVQGSAYRKQYGFNSIFLIPVNLYGPGDKFDTENSHVIPALIRKFVEAKKAAASEVTVWGTGKATREFLYVEDAADAIMKATEKYNDPDPVNIGSHLEISIRDLAYLIKRLVGFRGKVLWDTNKPDGQPRRKLDTTRAFEKFGFRAKTDFKAGLKKTIAWYKKN